MSTAFREHVQRAVRISGSQRKLADAAGISQQLISQLCTIAPTISKETALALVRATDGQVSLFDLMPEVVVAVRAELSREAPVAAPVGAAAA